MYTFIIWLWNKFGKNLQCEHTSIGVTRPNAFIFLKEKPRPKWDRKQKFRMIDQLLLLLMLQIFDHHFLRNWVFLFMDSLVKEYRVK